VRPPCTIRALVGKVDGEVFGAIGLARLPEGMLFFSDYDPEFKWALRTRATLKGVLQVRDWVRKSRLPVMALADKNEPDSDRLLQKFGFTQVDACEVGGVYQWHS
jgi:hypothetical protein